MVIASAVGRAVMARSYIFQESCGPKIGGRVLLCIWPFKQEIKAILPLLMSPFIEKGSIFQVFSQGEGLNLI